MITGIYYIGLEGFFLLPFNKNCFHLETFKAYLTINKRHQDFEEGSPIS